MEIEPIEVPYEEIERRAVHIGKTNLSWNVYNAAIKFHKQFADEGLTPVFLLDPMTGGVAVTSQERLNGKFN